MIIIIVLVVIVVLITPSIVVRVLLVEVIHTEIVNELLMQLVYLRSYLHLSIVAIIPIILRTTVSLSLATALDNFNQTAESKLLSQITLHLPQLFEHCVVVPA